MAEQTNWLGLPPLVLVGAGLLLVGVFLLLGLRYRHEKAALRGALLPQPPPPIPGEILAVIFGAVAATLPPGTKASSFKIASVHRLSPEGEMSWSGAGKKENIHPF